MMERRSVPDAKEVAQNEGSADEEDVGDVGEDDLEVEDDSDPHHALLVLAGEVPADVADADDHRADHREDVVFD